MKRAIIFISVFLLSCGGKTDFNTSSSNQIGLVTENITAVRIEPYLYSSKVFELNKGDRVEITESSKEIAYIGKTKNYWFKIKTESGLTGWIYGGNVRLFSAGSDFSAGNFEKKIKEEEQEKILKELVGKWWSVNTREEFTSYWISVFKDGNYEAKHKDSSKLYKGKYTLNISNSTISFDSGTPLGDIMKLSERGFNYYIEYADDKDNYRFKKVSSDPKSEEEVETAPEPAKEQDNQNAEPKSDDTNQ